MFMKFARAFIREIEMRRCTGVAEIKSSRKNKGSPVPAGYHVPPSPLIKSKQLDDPHKYVCIPARLRVTCNFPRVPSPRDAPSSFNLEIPATNQRKIRSS